MTELKSKEILKRFTNSCWIKKNVLTKPDDTFRENKSDAQNVLIYLIINSYWILQPKIMETCLCISYLLHIVFCQNLKSLHVWGLGEKFCLTFWNEVQWQLWKKETLRPNIFRQLNRDLAAPLLSRASGWKTTELIESRHPQICQSHTEDNNLKVLKWQW